MKPAARNLATILPAIVWLAFLLVPEVRHALGAPAPAPAPATTAPGAGGARDSQWRLVGELEARAVSLAHRGNELLVVLDNGDWKIVSDNGSRSGIPLPGRADVLALAGDGDDVWAVGAGGTAEDESAAATAST